MILGQQSRIVSMDVFQAGLQKAAQGVLLFLSRDAESSSRGPTYATTWLITDTLVVVPRYVLLPHEKVVFSVRRSGDTTETIATPVDPSPPSYAVDANTDSFHKSAVLLRLAQPMPGCALPLETASALSDHTLFLLHFSGGMDSMKISVGRFVGVSSDTLEYDADSMAGSSGAPIFSESGWTVLGMHTGSGESRSSNYGRPLALVLEDLRQSSAWPEIAAHHRLANVSATGQGTEAGPAMSRALESTIVQPSYAMMVETSSTGASKPELLAAALRWTFDPDVLGRREQYAPFVIDADESSRQWVLEDDTRRELLQGRTLTELRRVRGKEKSENPGQEVIDKILQGPPYPMSKIADAALPYWLQAVRWFKGIAPGLPTVATINRELGRRRVRGDLRVLTKDKVRGRKTELEHVQAWFENTRKGPLVISGLGGIGKSTLIAQFVLDQPEKMLLLWLDFDRSDLSPDDAVSILKVIVEQMKVQLANFVAPTLNENEWKQAAAAIGKQLKAETREELALMVLDGFEIAQHEKRHDEIWDVLNVIMAAAPRVRVIVSGRAPVHGLKLKNKAAVPLALKGMTEKDAKLWLKQSGVEDEKVHDQVWKNSKNGVPLVLKLALRLIREGGTEDLANTLPQKLVEGFLYRRILNRVVDDRLKPLAKDALVLRNVTENMVAEILYDRLPQELTTQTAFAELAREMALISPGMGGSAIQLTQDSDTGALQVRPEVRTASLRLLEMDDAPRVREIDQRAVAWYEQQDLSETSYRADVIYHYLRLGRIADAERLWRPDCGRLLKYAEEDLQEDATVEREWLRFKVTESENSLESWEEEAVKRIRGHQRRGLVRSLGQILSERTDRSTGSPLVFYDVWQEWQNGRLPEARRILDSAGSADGEIQRNRTLLAALVAVGEGKPQAADKLLLQIQGEKKWRDPIEALAVMAARIRLTVDLEKELDVAEQLGQVPMDKAVTRHLPPCDVIFSELSKLLGRKSRAETTHFLWPPETVDELPEFAMQLQKRRMAASGLGLSIAKKYPVVRNANLRSLAQPFPGGTGITPSKDLFNKAWKRWMLSANSMFLRDASELGATSSATQTMMWRNIEASIFTTLVAFRGIDIGFRNSNNIDEAVMKNSYALARNPARPSDKTLELIKRASALLPASEQWLKRRIEAILTSDRNDWTLSDLLIGTKVKASPFLSWLVLLLAPDPLQALCERVGGLNPNS
ncbi:hypothetical protein DES53_111163 [Roseimicrobium gellanilyticum]|uniref:Serine protease n=1 Tax=Roseimicrobium gellanilyticum TaxID=748857 RepID=A0A366H949_9BACT|nr:hypothetical protein [Roseimicrobium gellanilyticum]RBP38643.1 hypothetical protein DES53_111163 [Roseimicrobium gellanilyticum]